MRLRRLLAACTALALVAAPMGALAQDPSLEELLRIETGAWGYDISGRNEAIRPGDDFFDHANGGWIARTQIPSDRSFWGPFDALLLGSRADIRDILEGEASNADHARANRLYASYMDEARANALGAGPLRSDLDAIRAAGDHEALARLMGEPLHGTLFDGYVWQAFDNPEANVFYVSHGGLGMPDRDFYLEPQFEPQRAAYLAYLTRGFELIGWADPAGSAQAVLAFEMALANLHLPSAERRDVQRMWNPMTPTEVEALAPGFPWAALFESYGVAGQPRVIVQERDAFAPIAALYAATPLETLQAWMAARLINNSARYLSDDFVQAHFAFNAQALFGQPQIAPRWERAANFVNGQMYDALGPAYVARRFSPEAKAEMEAMVANLQVAMRHRLGQLDWMSEATRAEALGKLDGFIAEIGYPSRYRSYDGLDIRDDDLFGNVRRVLDLNHAYEISRLSRPVDRREWWYGPQTVNASYNPTANGIFFPAGFLQPPMFNMAADPAVNYGAIGAVIGHEIIHGFDDQGRRVDGTGRLRDWWTSEDAARFEAQAARLGAQYESFDVVEGGRINGGLTMGENIADLGGVLIAYEAYRLSLNGQEAPVIDGLTGDQRFFLGYAQAWREIARDEALRAVLSSDPHSPGKWRANGVVRNVDAWYEAFDVQPGDALYLPPEERVRIW